MPNRYKAGKVFVLSRAVCSVTLSYCRTFFLQTSVTTAFSLLLQLLQTDLLFLRGLAEGLWPRGCLDGVLCLPFRTRVKPCPHSQKHSLTTVSVIYPHSLEAVWAPVGSSVQPFPVSWCKSSIHKSLAEILEDRKTISSDSSKFSCFTSSLLLLKQTKIKAASLYVLWVRASTCHKFTIQLVLTLRITETSHPVTFFKLNIQPPKSPPVVHAPCDVLWLYREEQCYSAVTSSRWTYLCLYSSSFRSSTSFINCLLCWRKKKWMIQLQTSAKYFTFSTSAELESIRTLAKSFRTGCLEPPEFARNKSAQPFQTRCY